MVTHLHLPISADGTGSTSILQHLVLSKCRSLFVRARMSTCRLDLLASGPFPLFFHCWPDIFAGACPFWAWGSKVNFCLFASLAGLRWRCHTRGWASFPMQIARNLGQCRLRMCWSSWQIVFCAHQMVSKCFVFEGEQYLLGLDGSILGLWYFLRILMRVDQDSFLKKDACFWLLRIFVTF